jgi:hypothetical protein
MSQSNILVAKTLRKNINTHKKRHVQCIETGLIYASSGDASDILSEQGVLISPRSILHNCEGRNKSAGGLHWRYAE